MLASVVHFTEGVNYIILDDKYIHIHNQYIQMLAETGIIGAIAFIGMYLSIVYSSFQRLKDENTRVWAVIAILCTVVFLVHGFMDYIFGIKTISYTYWYIIGVCFAWYNLHSCK